MDLSDVTEKLRRHRRAWWRPWRCRCGTRFPCSARLLAVDELVRVRARQACDWYPQYFADRQPWVHARRAAAARGWWSA